MNSIFRNPLKSAVILVAISCLLAVITSLIPGPSSGNASEVIRQAGKKLSSLEEEMISSLDKIRTLQDPQLIKDFFLKDHSKQGFSYYLLANNKLKFWSDNEPAVNDSLLSSTINGKLLKLSNGDFYSYKIQWSDTQLIGLILICHKYDYQNKYLINNFNQALGLNNYKYSESGEKFKLPNDSTSYNLSYRFSVKETPGTLFIVLISIIGLLVLMAVFLFFRYFARSTVMHIGFVAIIFMLRTLMIYFKWPGALYNLSVFDPSFYASSFYFNSLGDMLMNSALFLILTISIFENARPYKRMKLLLFLYWIFTAFSVHYLIQGLVINSRLNFELSSPADINIYSILAYTSISILLLSFLFVTGSVWRNLRTYFINGRHAWIGITICAIYTAVTLSQLNIAKEHESRKLLALKAEVRRDLVAEYLFHEQEKKIDSDTLIKSFFHKANGSNDLASYIIPKYLSGYLSKFEISLQEFVEYAPGDTNVNLNYYKELAAKGKKTVGDILYFVNNESGGANYLALIPVYDSQHRHTIVITMTPRLFRTTKGFPELLMSGTYQEVSPVDDYSIARYSSNTLVYQYGEYVYPLTGKDFAAHSEERYINVNGYSHLIHDINENSFIVVSRHETSLFNVLTLFSWMFIFMSIVAFFLFALSHVITVNTSWQWNLTRKVQSSVIFLVVLIFALVGTGTIYYIESKYLKDQNKSISDQVNALWFLVNDNLSMSSTSELTDEQKNQLDRVVNNTNIDFNLYDKEGRIIYSSQPKIFNVGIVSNRMNTTAYLEIYEEGLTQFIHPEKAGQLRYIAAYAPFTDRSGNISAFLNLPYFEKQNELNQEVSVFLSAIVNIYVLLFALAVFVTIFISSRITKPLLLIQAKMSGIKLGSMNEKIEYNKKDEIGQLVHEYNRMIDELADSAAKLSKSERESAWREMARQVAHEIKNPLTPMKLSVQHLHRTLKDGADKAMVDRITETLIKQIDSLSNIASAFSNFAQMPQAVPAQINLKDVISQVIDLYNDEGNIHLHADEITYSVIADRDQLAGVFSNLLKNAFQSVPEGKKPEINIRLRREPGCIVTEIADNGSGIPEDQKDKIFIPNFTTKSSGMGLGLAIARNIVEEANGKIWFSTSYNSGSSFFVSMPDGSGQV